MKKISLMRAFSKAAVVAVVAQCRWVGLQEQRQEEGLIAAVGRLLEEEGRVAPLRLTQVTNGMACS